jgi:hypothetical protein
MTRRSALLHRLLIALFAACNPVSPPTPVKVHGGPVDIGQVAGSWGRLRGEFGRIPCAGHSTRAGPTPIRCEPAPGGLPG